MFRTLICKIKRGYHLSPKIESFVLIPSFLVMGGIFLGVVAVERLLFCLRFSILFLVGSMGLRLETLELGRYFSMLDRISLIMIIMRLLVILMRV